jgi:uncharacterized SAM-binding protein YcdF (DUF218 family)
MLMRVLKWALLLVVGVALLCLLGFGVLCFEINYYGQRDLARPADAIVVLGAKVLPDGQPGPDLRARTQHAVDLYRAGLAPRLICTGGVQDDPASAAAVCRSLALSLDTPQQAIFLADGSANTEEDARRVALVMSQYEWRSAILVSHPLHLYRARLFFEKEGLTVYTSPTTTDLDRIDLPLRGYYTFREGVGILWPYVEDAGLPKEWTDALQAYIYAGP